MGILIFHPGLPRDAPPELKLVVLEITLLEERSVELVVVGDSVGDGDD